MGKTMSEYTKGKWIAGYNPRVTGPTTPNVGGPCCGGRDWPYRTINVGQETIAIVPAQDNIKQIGKRGESNMQSAVDNADLICALHNMAVSINPSNPLAVAEGMEELVKATKAVISMSKYMRIEAEHLDKVQSLNHLIKSLSKITGGK
jgi:hypothetical protein